MKREETTLHLKRIRALLDGQTPDIRQAQELIKSLLLQGPCVRELAEIREAALMILERLTMPALSGEKGKQNQVTGLIRTIRKPESLDIEAILAATEEIAPWIEAAAGKRGEAPPSVTPELVTTALQALGVLEPVPAEETGDRKSPPTPATRWREIHRLLGRLIVRERHARAAWAREKKGLQDAVTALAGDLVESSLIIGRKEGAGETWVKELTGQLLTRPDAVLAALLEEEQGFLAREREVETALARSQEAVTQFQTLLRRAERALMDTRDETLIDIFTGLPNRFAFLARLTKALEPAAGKKEPAEPFAVIFIRVDEYPEMIRALGRDRVNRVLSALASKIAALPRPEDYLARWGDETFALLCPATDTATAVSLATTLQGALFRVQFELSDALVSVRLGFGVVPYQPEMTDERLLGLAELESKAALEEGAKPVQVARIAPSAADGPTPAPRLPSSR
ncbi:MAG: diguanylate cyclase [Magnetococcales bacterium]|nr:diguanylate cyclase [Magnetococcales bacterium]